MAGGRDQKTITDLDGGYVEAAEWLGVTENALFNRLRADGDQIFLSAGQWSCSVLVDQTTLPMR
jgi:hypothetical protein